DVERALRGFTFHRQAVSTAGSTLESLPSVFAGRAVAHDAKAPWAAFNSGQSFVHWLRQAGYTTHAYLPRLWNFELRLFDRASYHVPPADVDHGRLFRLTWLLAYLPEAAAPWLRAAPESQRADVAAGRHLPASATVSSLRALRVAAEEEPRRPASGQYVFVHVMLPHTPYVLAADCTVVSDPDHEGPGPGGGASNPVEHARCATAQILAWVELLERLGRLDDALVVIHADHGALLDWSSGEPVRPPLAGARSLRSLLLVKLPGAPRTGSLQISDAPATLLDVAPTILGTTGARHELVLAGRPAGAAN
ncbi:MAG: LTA synthase family protein, partial [Vicinamibacteria bacterium]|nr:LTA synthase family protein [Vicinamibacteria bacterium]